MCFVFLLFRFQEQNLLLWKKNIYRTNKSVSKSACSIHILAVLIILDIKFITHHSMYTPRRCLHACTHIHACTHMHAHRHTHTRTHTQCTFHTCHLRSEHNEEQLRCSNFITLLLSNSMGQFNRGFVQAKHSLENPPYLDNT